MDNTRQPKSLRELLAQLDEQGITDYRRYDAVRRFLSFKAREKNVPISGSFELTPLCNLDCKMCYVHLNKDQMRGASLLDVDVWKDIMHQAIDAGMMYARLTGGECLTYPGLRELYLYLADRGVETSVLSNGVAMDADMVAFFREHPPADIQVTLYGARTRQPHGLRVGQAHGGGRSAENFYGLTWLHAVDHDGLNIHTW